MTTPQRSAVHRAASDAVTTTAATSAVFLDPSGRRWRTLRRFGSPVAVAVVLALIYAGFLAYQSPALPAGRSETTLFDLGLEDTRQLPVVGDGPLLRVVRLTKDDADVTAADPFSGEPVAMTPQEIQSAGDDEFVIQKFGYAPGQSKTISLTFDDGPHPINTPKLLDVLSQAGARATFFITASMAAQHPEIVQRIVREGHAVGNHSMTHADVSDVSTLQAREELVLADRVMRSVTGHAATSFRLPYGGHLDEHVSDNARGIMRAQQLGYQVAGFDFETLDWQYGSGEAKRNPAEMPLPSFDGGNITVLMHDGGADNRAATVDYVKSRLIPAARAAGYTFTTMPQANPDLRTETVTPTAFDHTVRALAHAAFVWPNKLIHFLFAMALVMVGVVGVSNVTLAVTRRRRQPRFGGDLPLQSVSIIIAAYNEEKVIGRTLETLLESTYPFLEILVVNDGSTDRTAVEVEKMALRDTRIRLLSQVNSGKWAALNNATAQARGDILVTLDADTVFTKHTVANLVRQFAVDHEGRLGAVAGVVRVGNRGRNLLTRWQSLEYLTQIGIERSAYAQVGAVPIIPGACAAWRKTAIVEAGGYSPSTLAEDCDLTLSLHQAGWQVSQDDEALAYTEAPDHVDALLAQRIRWTFGTLQAIFKHRNMLLRRRYGWLGMAVLPYMALSVLIPIVFLPFITVMGILTVQTSGWGAVGGYFLLFLLLHVSIAAVAVKLMRERWAHLLIIPIYRIVYEPLRAYLLYTSVYLAMRGVKLGWNKLQRTGALDDSAIAGTLDLETLPERTGKSLQEATQ